jgi:multidrug efflux pump subunit AcrA (membrane-fusion protein)
MGKAWNVQGSFVSPAERQRIAQQQAQQQRLAQEQAEQQRLAQQQAEQQRLAQQQAEQQRLAQQQAEQRRLAQQQAEQRRLAQQQAEQQRLAQQQAEQRRLAQQQQAASQSASGERFVNVARGKQATQSSTGFDAPADRAIDGNRDGDFWRGSVTHTAEGGGGSWQVDLGAVYDIDRVQIFNRTDCCMERLQAALVVANFPVVRNASEAVFVQRLGDMATRSSLVVHVNARGRYVSIVQQTGEFLHLAEVEVLVKSQ